MARGSRQGSTPLAQAPQTYDKMDQDAMRRAIMQLTSQPSRSSFSSLQDAGITGSGSETSEGPLVIEAISDSSPLSLHRPELVGDVLPLLQASRDSVIVGYLGIQADDKLCFLAPDGTTVIATFDEHGPNGVTFDLNESAAFQTSLVFNRQGTPVGAIGMISGDRLAIFAPDLTTIVAWSSDDTHWNVPGLVATFDVQAPIYLDGNGVQVLKTQQAGIADAAVTAVGSISHAAGNPPTKTEYDALVDDYNALVTDFTALMGKFNTLLHELSLASGGHGIIA